MCQQQRGILLVHAGARFRGFFFSALLILSIAASTASALEIGLGHISDTISNETQPRDGDSIHITAPRGGHATGVIVVRGAPAAAQARLSRNGLRQGRHDLSQALHIYYGSKRRDYGPARGQDDNESPFFDALIPGPDDPAQVLPIYVHISVPEDASPGSYEGQIEVRGRGGAQQFDITVEVAPFIVPPPQERRAWVDMLQSPDSVAYRYGVPLYSRQHLQLMRPVMKKMRQLGQQVMHVSAIAQSHFGNDEAMIPIGEGGIDWRGLEGYMSLYNEMVGEPRFVVVYVVDRGGNTGSGDRAPRWTPPGGRRQGSTPAEKVDYSDRYRPAWQAAMEGIKQRLEQAGWEDTEILLGWIGDGRPFGDYLPLFSEIAPFARWVQFTHARGDPSPNDQGQLQVLDMDVAYRILPYFTWHIAGGSGRDRSPVRRGGWDAPFLQATSMRGSNDQYQEPAYWLGQVPHAVSSDRSYRGIARIGMDFWVVTRPDGGNGRLLGRFARWHNLQRETARALVAPGPNGALPTVRYLAMAQGAQETEARILVEMALKVGQFPPGLDRSQVEEVLETWSAMRLVDPKAMAAENEHEVLRALYGIAHFVQGQL